MVEISEDALVSAASPRRRRGYLLVVLLTLVWVAGLLTIAVTVVPDGYWYSYFAVDYSQGFIRRGLAGELVRLVPTTDQLSALKVLRWVPTISFIAALLALAWTVATRWCRSERRLLLALLIPFLPFGFAFAIFSARPDLFGAAALIGLCIALTRVKTEFAAIAVSAVYGCVIAVLALIHEAIPLLFALGALAGLSVLAGQLRTRNFWLASAIAVLPGLLATAAVAHFGRRGVSAQLCEHIPHIQMNNPLGAHPPPSFGQILRGFHYDVDYHDWACRWIIPLFDQSFRDGVRFIANVGPLALSASTLFGFVLLVGTMFTLSRVSGVRLEPFRRVLLQRPLFIVFGAVLFVPVFATGADWIRWWVIITFDLAVVFLLFAAARSESAALPNRIAWWTFGGCAVLLGLLPLGIIPAIGVPGPM
ncbi:MAG: hypothetical protein ACOYB7_13955 [Mycobacterium sp.]